MNKPEEGGEKSPYARLARAAIEAWSREKRRIDPEAVPESGDISGKAGAFVSLKKRGDLRGCIGTYRPTCDTLAEEIISNAISAASRDPRFPPVMPDELEDLDISVDILGEPEAVPDISHLDPRKYGVIVQRGNRVGLLLPDLEGVDTVEQQVEIARSKAGISPHEPVQIYRFSVDRYT